MIETATIDAAAINLNRSLRLAHVARELAAYFACIATILDASHICARRSSHDGPTNRVELMRRAADTLASTTAAENHAGSRHGSQEAASW